ncbi:hypothetical protein [Rhodococcoides yunnanense]|uniref:hypothetical protein n=1 Tax=Rhodococcoides yunnanense TaxID=278209 RepID=UPI000934A4B9|nr:hypothetical protein [Rhodococcus yunnanensis]
MIDVPADLNSVLRRWNPAGLDGIARAARVTPRGVHITGIAGSGVSALRTQLERSAGDALEHSPDVASAAAVVFVLDAAAPIGRRALAELTPALESTAVAVVVNKIDVHREWRSVARVVASSIAELVPRAVDVSFWATSAALAERSRIAVDPDVRRELYEESGIEELAAFVVSASAQSIDVARRRKFHASVHAAAAGARHEIVNKARAVTSASSTAGLRAERARLTDRRDRERAERTATLRSRLQLARAESIHDINEETRGFASRARESIATAARSESKHLSSHLIEQLAQGRERVDSRLTVRMRAIADDLELGVDIPAHEDLPAESVEPAARTKGVEDRVMVVVGASAGVGLGRIAVSPLSTVPALDLVILPMSLLVGALSAWWLVRSRALIADRAHLRTWSADAAASAKSSWEQAALARVLAVESVFVPASSESVRSSLRTAESDLERVEAELRSAAERRAGVLAACDRDLAALDRGVEKFPIAHSGGTVGIFRASKHIDGFGVMKEDRSVR